MDLEGLKNIGIAAAYQGAGVLREHFGKLKGVHKKGAVDLVTDADLASEKVIVEVIRAKYPEHAVIAEESGLSSGGSEHCWWIDPLDGTTNFAHDLGIFCISIAYGFRGRMQLGVVLCPTTGELFTAAAGGGAALNGNPIRVSQVAHLSESLLVTGFPYDFKDHLPSLMARFSRCLAASQGVRRLGSAALDLCYVACGRFEAFWEENLKPWDTAAGYLIAAEAGATVTDFANRPYAVDGKQILATNGKIHAQMRDRLELK